MPQELRVVQCFSCQTYQGDIVKKVAKWTCKMCGEKQNLNKVFGTGNGKECRIIVQDLNQRRSMKQENFEVMEHREDGCLDDSATAADENLVQNEAKHTIKSSSKWSQFGDSAFVQPQTSGKSVDLQSENIFEGADDNLDNILNFPG